MHTREEVLAKCSSVSHIELEGYEANYTVLLDAKQVIGMREIMHAYAELLGDGWRDIESAPKSGTKVLIAMPDGDIALSNWTHGICHGWRDGWLEYIGDDGLPIVFSDSPTHWMPLPQPPKQGGV